MTAPTDSEIFDKICELLKPYNPKIMELEDHYDVSIPMEMVSDIKTVGELVTAVKGLTA